MDNSMALEKQKKLYKDMVDKIRPKPPVLRNVFWAFLVGGLISLIGQLIMGFYQSQGLSVSDAGAAASATLVFLAAFLTGLGIYDEITRRAGAGSIIPITGFANSMVAPAMEYHAEGLVFGVGARLFTIAGPVLVFGMVTAWVAGILYYFFR